MAHPDDVGGRGGFAEHRDDRIARHQMDNREGQRRDAERDGNQREQAARQVRITRIIRRCSAAAGRRSSVSVASERRLPFG